MGGGRGPNTLSKSTLGLVNWGLGLTLSGGWVCYKEVDIAVETQRVTIPVCELVLKLKWGFWPVIKALEGLCARCASTNSTP